MSSDAISKNKLVVQDDFFNEIVDGLKSHVEEKIETKDAKSSRVQLGGKQLTLFRDKVAPIFGEEIGKNQMVQDYMQHVSDSYEKKKIQQIRDDFYEAINGYIIINGQTEDELEEIKKDKKGSTAFLFEGFKLLNTIRKMMSFYQMILEMKAHIRKRDDNTNFSYDEYDLTNPTQLKKAGEDTVAYLNEEGLRFVPAMRPLLIYMTNAIYDVSQKAFKEINTAIYWEIAKMIAQIAAEIGASIAITIFTGGAGAGVWGKVGASIGNMMLRVGKFLSVGLKFGRITRSVYRTGKVGRGFVRATFAANNAARRTARWAFEHRKGVWRTLKAARAGMEIYDIIDVDEEDLNEVSNWARRRVAPYRERVETQWNSVIRDFNTIRTVNEVYSDITRKVTQNMRERIYDISNRNQEKYNSEVRIKNLNFDFDTVGRLSTFFKNAYVDCNSVNFNTFVTNEGNIYTFVGTNLQFDMDAKELKWTLRENQFSDLRLFEAERNYYGVGEEQGVVFTEYIKNFKINATQGLSVVEILSFIPDGSNESFRRERTPLYVTNRGNYKTYIRFDETKGNKGVDLQFGQFGSISGMRLYLEYNPSFFRGRVDKWSSNLHDIIWAVCFRGAIVAIGDQEEVRRKYVSSQINFYKNGVKVADPFNGKIRVTNNGDFIDVQGFTNELSKFTLRKRKENGEKVTFQSTDLSEVVLHRESIISTEKDFGKKIEEFYNMIHTVMTTKNLTELREAAEKAIEQRNIQMQNDPNRQRRGDVVHYVGGTERDVFKMRYDYGSYDLRTIVSKMSEEELRRIIAIDDINDTTQVLERHGVSVEIFKVTENTQHSSHMHVGH